VKIQKKKCFYWQKRFLVIFDEVTLRKAFGTQYADPLMWIVVKLIMKFYRNFLETKAIKSNTLLLEYQIPWTHSRGNSIYHVLVSLWPFNSKVCNLFLRYIRLNESARPNPFSTKLMDYFLSKQMCNKIVSLWVDESVEFRSCDECSIREESWTKGTSISIFKICPRSFSFVKNSITFSCSFSIINSFVFNKENKLNKNIVRAFFIWRNALKTCPKLEIDWCSSSDLEKVETFWSYRIIVIHLFLQFKLLQYQVSLYFRK
jgi:hypothetical protein